MKCTLRGIIVSLCIFTSLFTINSVCAQFQRVVEPGKSWNYFSLNFNEQMDSCVIVSDTVIDQKVYYEIYSYYGWGMGPELIGYIREDTMAGQLYRLTSLSQINEEELVYDISLEIGDTISVELIEYVVDSIGFKEGRKYIYIMEPYGYMYGPIIFIEGVGSIANMFGIPAFEYRHSLLLCAHFDSLNIYTHDYMEWFPYLDSNLCWADVTSRVEVYGVDIPTSTYPNPFTTYTTIEYELTEPSYVQLTIYNAIGESVHVAIDGIKPQGLNTYVWRTVGLPGGLYYAVMRTEEGVRVVKMVKQ